ncbi:kinase-like domain-containing protein [Trametes polyzona]|nr:kinase-like domain-containing protein [Trametes polyzona]
MANSSPPLPNLDVEAARSIISEPHALDTHMPSVSTGLSVGETLCSTSSLAKEPSLLRVKSLGDIFSSESRSTVGSKSDWRSSTMPSDQSFEVEEVGNIKAIDSGWLDDEVEEVMVVKKKRRKPLSVIMEAMEGISHSPPKAKRGVAVGAVDFEYIRTLRVGDVDETLIARKAESGAVHTVKLVRKSGYNATTLTTRIMGEQKILRVLTECSVPFTVRLYWSFEDDRAMYLVMDRTDVRTLRNAIESQGPLSSPEAIACAAELVEGISGLHALGIVHTTLKPDSILIGEDGHLIVSDFDDAVFLHDDDERDLVTPRVPPPNSLQYQAPEMILGWEYDYAVDWWSFGLVLFWVLMGTHPFIEQKDADHASIVQSKILHAAFTDEQLAMDENACHLIIRCLQRNPALRIDGPGVRMHAYFHGVNWEDVVTKRAEAPFARQRDSPIQDLDDREHEAEEDLDRRNGRTLVSPATCHESFAFDWRSSVPVGDAALSGSPAIGGHLQALHDEYGPSDKTLRPQDFAPSPTLGGLSVPGSRARTPEREDLLSTSGEFGALPNGVSGSSAKIGNLRRYSSLNFDLQSSASGMSLGAIAEGATGDPEPSPVQLRHARSILGLSLGSTDDSLGAPSWTSRLRRRTRPETPPLSAPIPQLPKGVRQIGNGIGYTRRADVRRSVLTLASLTPRTCQAMFNGRFPKFGGKRKQKEHEPLGNEVQQGSANEGVEDDDGEDQMDAVMREIYGDDWAAAGSSPAEGGESSVRMRERDGGRVGLGWDDALTRYGAAPVDASFAGPDSTLRLVSPSTPRLGVY